MIKLPLIIGFFFLIQTAHISDNIIIQKDQKTISEMSKMEYQIPFPGVSLIDVEKYNMFLDQLDKDTYQPPVNAFIDDNGRIIAEQTGSKLHRKQFTDLFYTQFYQKGSAEIELPMLTIYPKVDRDLLIQIKETQIGQYTTYYNVSNVERSYNIHLSAEAINNHVVFPGETFSFNKVVGQRTKKRGYKRAPVIVRGEISEDIGGGICQVSSTLFNAVDRAGVKIGQRYSHSRRVPYVPPGRDATVSWYGPDFTFINQYDHPLLIMAKAINGQMIIRIFSSNEVDIEPRQISSVSGA